MGAWGTHLEGSEGEGQASPGEHTSRATAARRVGDGSNSKQAGGCQSPASRQPSHALLVFTPPPPLSFWSSHEQRGTPGPGGLVGGTPPLRRRWRLLDLPACGRAKREWGRDHSLQQEVVVWGSRVAVTHAFGHAQWHARTAAACLFPPCSGRRRPQRSPHAEPAPTAGQPAHLMTKPCPVSRLRPTPPFFTKVKARPLHPGNR